MNKYCYKRGINENRINNKTIPYISILEFEVNSQDELEALKLNGYEYFSGPGESAASFMNRLENYTLKENICTDKAYGSNMYLDSIIYEKD